MLHDLELEIIKMLLEQQLMKKEELIVKLNTGQRKKKGQIWGYRALKQMIKALERKSLIRGHRDGNYQLTELGEAELEAIKLTA